MSDATLLPAESSHVLGHILGQIPALMAVLVGPDHRFAFANDQYQALVGGRAILGQPVATILPEVVAQGFIELLDGVYASGKTYDGTDAPLVLTNPTSGQDEQRYVDFTYQLLLDGEGQPYGILAFGVDVTDKVLARRGAEHLAQRLQTLTDALPVLIGYLDRERRYRFANEAYRAWFGVDPTTLLGRLVREVIGEAAYAATCGYMDRALAGERLAFEARMPYRVDLVRHIHTDYIPDVQQGQVQGFYTLVTDITGQILARNQVQSLNDELTIANRQLLHTNGDLDAFVYTASHDLKAPITNVEGLLTVLREELPATAVNDPAIAYILSLMDSSVQRFQQTLTHLTDIVKLQHVEAEDMPIVDIGQVVEDVRLDLRPLIEATQATLEVDVRECPTLRFSPKHLRSIIANLLSNAIKYHVPGRKPLVRLRTVCQDGWNRIEVNDNGLGLTAAQQTNLFGLFRRYHTHVEGSGVGLYAVKKLVESTGGIITVDSEVEVGSTFSVMLPAQP